MGNVRRTKSAATKLLEKLAGGRGEGSQDGEPGARRQVAIDAA